LVVSSDGPLAMGGTCGAGILSYPQEPRPASSRRWRRRLPLVRPLSRLARGVHRFSDPGSSLWSTSSLWSSRPASGASA